MMAALLRLELYPQPISLDSVPPEQVLAKFFANTEPARLNVYSGKKVIGFCHVEILPVATVTNQPDGYRVQCDLAMSFPVLGMPSRVHMVGSGVFNSRFDVREFKFKTAVGDGHVDVQGDDRSRKVTMDIDLGDTREHREYEFGQLSGAGWSGLLALPGQNGTGEARREAKGTTQVYRGRLPDGGLTQRAYLVDTKLDDTMWARLWIDESGQVLLVETSAGLSMRADVLDGFTADERGQAIAKAKPVGKGRRE
jgi:hypothetical protein